MEDIRDGDWDAMEKLMYALILSGVVMQMAGSTWAVSGAEHMAAHLWDMKDPERKRDSLHGEEVGVALVLVTEHYKKLEKAISSRTGEGKIGFCPRSGDGAAGEDLPGYPRFWKACWRIMIRTPLDEIDLEKLEDQLDQIRDLIHDLPESYEIVQKLNEAGCVTRPEAIGLTPEMIENTLRVSPYVRNRVTLLRLEKLLERV